MRPQYSEEVKSERKTWCTDAWAPVDGAYVVAAESVAFYPTLLEVMGKQAIILMKDGTERRCRIAGSYNPAFGEFDPTTSELYGCYSENESFWIVGEHYYGLIDPSVAGVVVLP